MLVCKRCGLDKALDAFRRNSATSTGRIGVCIECQDSKRPPPPKAPPIQPQEEIVTGIRRGSVYKLPDGRIVRLTHMCGGSIRGIVVKTRRSVSVRYETIRHAEQLACE